MLILSWQAEQFSATGNATAEGVRNQLGRPNLDSLTILIREAAQNSWDARLRGGQVIFGVAGSVLSRGQRQCLMKQIFRDAPANLNFAKFWETGAPRVLTIFDRMTTGLNGPTRADEVTPEVPQRERNFVAFFRNIGQPRKAEFGGGTYGYGKAVFYSASRLRTIVVHTRCRINGTPESRFMAAALGTPYSKCTGRHWWGVKGRSDVVDPVVGRQADQVAELLGLPTFGSEETGTTIMILDPVLGDIGEEGEVRERAPEDAMTFMAASALWNFWPKLLTERHSKAAMKLHFSWNGSEIKLPDPASHPSLYGFVTAMENLKAAEASNSMLSAASERTMPIASLRPKQHLGVLSLVRFPSVPQTILPSKLEAAIHACAPHQGRCRHIALMRNPELIVRYEPGPENEVYEYSGVFKVDREASVDRAFADSEPPTHDDWEPNTLEGFARTYVRVALRRIKEAVKDFALPSTAAETAVEQLPLGTFSEMLGGLIPSLAGTGAEVESNEPAPPSRGEKGGGTKAPVVEIIGTPELILLRRTRALRIRFQVRAAPDSAATVVCAFPRVAVLDGNSFENEAPLGERSPEVLRWELATGVQLQGQPECRLLSSERGPHSVIVSVPGEAMLSVALEARAE